MEWIQSAIEIFLHLDKHLNEWAGMLGPALYVLLFVIVFCETGLVVTPFLPGDSLLFAVGALAAVEGAVIDPILVTLVLAVAAILGDAVNYGIGYRLGPKVFASEESWLFNKQHLLRTQAFYEKYGGKTIVLARFMPIIRTFAPFVAGIGKMRYPRFAMFNVTGGITWVLAFVFAGYLFGNVPVIKKNFSLVILAIIVISVIPVAVEILRARAEAKRASAAGSPQPAKD